MDINLVGIATHAAVYMKYVGIIMVVIAIGNISRMVLRSRGARGATVPSPNATSRAISISRTPLKKQ